jgi:uncharacterized damage-inducible protein DinB
MSFPDLHGHEMIAWLERTSAGWRDLLQTHPEALALPCDIRETHTVSELLQHIVAVELRFAERLSDLPQTGYDDIPLDSAASLFATHDRAMNLLASLQSHHQGWWQESIQFTTRSAGALAAPRTTVFFHLLLHSIRHYAQLATLLRQHSIAPGWMMDYLDMRPKNNLS